MIRRLLLGIASLLLVPCLGSLARDSESPPGRYALSDVSFEYVTNAGQEGRSIRVYGNGKGVVRSSFALREDVVSEFTVSPEEIRELLDLCYWERFFDLRSNYSVPSLIRLGDDGMIDTQTFTAADVTSTRVSLRIGEFTKAVGYLPVANPPPVLTEIARRIEKLWTASGGRSSNCAVNATVLASRRLQGKRRASRPARYRGR